MTDTKTVTLQVSGMIRATSKNVTEAHLAAARDAADKLLSNPVIEDVISVHDLADEDAR